MLSRSRMRHSLRTYNLVLFDQKYEVFLRGGHILKLTDSRVFLTDQLDIKQTESGPVQARNGLSRRHYEIYVPRNWGRVTWSIDSVSVCRHTHNYHE